MRSKSLGFPMVFGILCTSLPALVGLVRVSPRWIYAGEKVQAYRASRPPLSVPYLRQWTFVVPTILAQGHTTLTTQHKVVIV